MVATRSPGRVGLELLSRSDVAILPSEDVRGREVHDADNRRVGQVDDLVVDRESGRVRLILVGEGGVLGLGRRHRLIPVDVIDSTPAGWVFLSTSVERVNASTETRSVDDIGHVEEIYRAYGCRPFWTDGYVTPDWTRSD